MSTFYLMPPRRQVGQMFGRYLESLFPGLRWDQGVWNDLAETLGAAAHGHPHVFVVYREDLPDGRDPAVTLCAHFGAEPGDEIVEILPDKTERRWRIDPAHK